MSDWLLIVLIIFDLLLLILQHIESSALKKATRADLKVFKEFEYNHDKLIVKTNFENLAARVEYVEKFIKEYLKFSSPLYPEKLGENAKCSVINVNYRSGQAEVLKAGLSVDEAVDFARHYAMSKSQGAVEESASQKGNIMIWGWNTEPDVEYREFLAKLDDDAEEWYEVDKADFVNDWCIENHYAECVYAIKESEGEDNDT